MRRCPKCPAVHPARVNFVARRAFVTLVLAFAAVGAPWLVGCADMDQCSLGLCAKPCPATVPTGSTTTGAGGAGGEGGASVCSPRGTITSGN